MKGIAIYFWFLGSASPAPAPATGTGAGKSLFLNNSALGGHRALPKVANERYCNIVLIFGVGIAGTGTGTGNFFFNNSALGGHRALPKVANERYCCIYTKFPLICPSRFLPRLQTWITRSFSTAEQSPGWQMKGIDIYFWFLGLASPAPAPATSTGAGNFFFLNNSALGGHRALPKVANERYCYIFFIFGVGIAGTGNRYRRRHFFLITQLRVVTERSRRWQMKGIAVYILNSP